MNSSNNDIHHQYVPPITITTNTSRHCNVSENFHILHNSILSVRKDDTNSSIRYITIRDKDGNENEYPNYFAFILRNPLLERDYNMWEQAAKSNLKDAFPDFTVVAELKEYLLNIPIKTKESFRDLSLDFYFKCVSFIV